MFVEIAHINQIPCITTSRAQLEESFSRLTCQMIHDQCFATAMVLDVDEEKITDEILSKAPYQAEVVHAIVSCG